MGLAFQLGALAGLGSLRQLHYAGQNVTYGAPQNDCPMNRPGPEKLLTRSGPNRHGRSHKNKKQTLGRSNMQFRLNFRPTALAAFGLLAAAAPAILAVPLAAT